MALVSLSTDTPTPIPTQLILPITTPTPAPTRFILPTTTFIIPLIGNLASSEGDTNGIVPPVISNAGQIAIIVNKVLFVQTSIDADEFRAIDHGIVDAEWSLDGSELYYWQSNYTSEFATRFRWLAKENVSELAEDPHAVHVFLDSLIKIYQISPERFLYQEHCGVPCETLYLLDAQDNVIWRLPWSTAGMFAISPNNTYLINAGRVDFPSTEASIDRVDLQTGAIQVIWRTPMVGWGFSLRKPSITPNGEYFSFNYGGLGDSPGTLHIITSEGQPIWEIGPHSLLVDWQPNSNGLVAVQYPEISKSQLFYLSLNEPISQTLSLLDTSKLTGGKWNPDGRQFALSIHREMSEHSELRLWTVNSADSILVYYADTSEAINNLEWSPDGLTLYFTLGENRSSDTYPYPDDCLLCSSAWKYSIKDNKVELITAILK